MSDNNIVDAEWRELGPDEPDPIAKVEEIRIPLPKRPEPESSMQPPPVVETSAQPLSRPEFGSRAILESLAHPAALPVQGLDIVGEAKVIATAAGIAAAKELASSAKKGLTPPELSQKQDPNQENAT